MEAVARRAAGEARVAGARNGEAFSSGQGFKHFFNIFFTFAPAPPKACSHSEFPLPPLTYPQWDQFNPTCDIDHKGLGLGLTCVYIYRYICVCADV
jgi:hypothetical protein